MAFTVPEYPGFRFPGGEERDGAAGGSPPWLVIDPKPYTGDPAYDVLLG